MDMKRILQALDSAATKPVAGVSDMARFLKVVSEADINQVPPMPDVTGLQPGQPKDLGQGTNVVVNKDGTVSYSGAWGVYVYNAQGQHIKTQSPSFSGYSQETDTAGNVTQQNYQQGPLNVQKTAQGTTANYQLGDKNLTTQVQENDLSKFLSIIDKNDVEVLMESNPHKVSLPVQMAMQHFQQPEKIIEKKPSLLKKYFAEAEEESIQKQTEKSQLIKQYSQRIAKKVLESSEYTDLKDKEDLESKRKALQDIQLDPNTHKDQSLKAELFRRHLALEKEARRKGLSEASLSPEQIAKLQQFKQKNAKPVQPQSAQVEPLSAEKQAEIDQWGKDLASYFNTRSTTGKPSKNYIPTAEPKQEVEPEERSIDVEGLSLPELQDLLKKNAHLIRLLEKIDKLKLRAEKFPGGLTPGLESDLESTLPTPTSSDEYDEHISFWSDRLAKLEQFVAMKRATWSKKKTHMYEGEEPMREESVVRKEIAALQPQLNAAEHAFSQARKITTGIKYEDPTHDIIVGLQGLVSKGLNIDKQDLEWAIKEVHEKMSELQAAVFALDDPFEQHYRNLKYKLDELENEISDIQDMKKYGRGD